MIRRILTNREYLQYITEYHIISKLIFLRISIPKFMNIRQLFHLKMYVKMSKSTCLKAFWTFESQLSSCYALYIVPNSIRNHHTMFEIVRTDSNYRKTSFLKTTYYLQHKVEWCPCVCLSVVLKQNI